MGKRRLLDFTIILTVFFSPNSYKDTIQSDLW